MSLGEEDRHKNETPEEKRTRVLAASYDKLSSLEKFRLDIDLRLMSRVYDMDSHKWFYGLHDDVLTRDLRGNTTKALNNMTGRVKSIYGGMSAGMKALVILVCLFLFLMIIPAITTAIKNRDADQELNTLLYQSLFAITVGLIIRWGSYWFVRGMWT